MFIDKHVKFLGRVGDDIFQSFVDGRRPVSDLLENGLEDDDVAESWRLQKIDLFQDNVGVENNVVGACYQAAAEVTTILQLVACFVVSFITCTN